MPDRPPNLLFLYTDEQRYDTLACYGNERIEMPNLNRLAESSTVFDEAYVTQPVCTPSRSSLLTGQWPHTNGCTRNNIPLRPETPCVPEMLTRGDYVTGHYGKWHLGDEIFPQHGFDHWRGIEDQYRPHYSPSRDRTALSDYQQFLIHENGLVPEGMDHFHRGAVAELPERFSKPAYLAREAQKFLRANAENPFCLFVNFLEPHMPFTGPRDGQYDPAEIPLPDNFDAPPGPDAHLRSRISHRQWTRQFRGADDYRALISRYWGLCSQVDTYAGQILDTLEELGLADNTIVVYTSDHGDMMGSHQLVAKTVMYQEAVRVPLLVRLPGQSLPRRVRGPVSQIDLVPTLLELMGQDLPHHLQGTSLANQVRGESSRLDRDVFIEWSPDTDTEAEVPDHSADLCSQQEYIAGKNDPVRTIITPDGWRYSHSPRGDHELYNLREDPGERRNLAGRGDTRDLTRDLTARIAAWRQRTGDTDAAG
jgi:arylsulfatase A-like enzyme